MKEKSYIQHKYEFKKEEVAKLLNLKGAITGVSDFSFHHDNITIYTKEEVE
jgi:hypothetical protein